MRVSRCTDRYCADIPVTLEMAVLETQTILTELKQEEIEMGTTTINPPTTYRALVDLLW